MNLEHLARHRLAKAVDASDAVLHFEDGADFLDVELVEVGGFDLAEQNILDLAGAKRGLGCHALGRKELLVEGAVELVKIITRPAGKQLAEDVPQEPCAGVDLPRDAPF
jgi:hypothetical protein